MAAGAIEQIHALEPYVPRILAEWDLDAPGRRWQSVDGTLCFVDISGFTNLSEKLARRGRIGAEELTDVLDRVFGQMLRLAYARRGSLLKFGGDALLLLFEGDEHPMQATCAAVEMRTALREAVKIPTSVGRIDLRMSVGVHTGSVDLFRVGASHRELIITGATATETTEMEAAADAGEIVISDVLRDALPGGCAVEQKGSGWILRWRTPRAAAVGPVIRRSVPGETVAGCVPTQLRDHLSAAHAEPEHRIATVGFVKFKGIEAEQRRNGVEGVANGLDLLLTYVQRAVDAEGVTFLSTDIDEDGGKVILTTGVPTIQEDDEGRMLRALRRIADSDQIFPLKIGTNRGHVFAGEIGTEFRRSYTVMGDTVNLAARLMVAAPPGAVYAAPGVLDRSRTRFETAPLEPFLVKGKAEPVQAYAVGAEAGVRRSRDRGILPFAGREEELAALVQAIERLDERGAVFTIAGPTGIGKSRLAEEAIASTGVEGLLVRAEPNGTGNPYWAFRDPMRSLLGIERRSQEAMARDLTEIIDAGHSDLVDELPLLATVLHIEMPDNPTTAAIEPRFRPSRTADVLLRLLDRVISSPCVILAEDGHWMDEASLALINQLADVAIDRGWLVVLTVRKTTDDSVGSTIELGPLSRDQARSVVVAATEAAPLRPSELDVVVARAGGNPLFLGEIVRVVRETGSVEDLPDTLDAVVGAEIDALAPLPRRLLRMSSVLGRSFRKVVLAGLLADEDVELDAATTSALGHFVEDDGARFRFRHATVHEAAYGGLPYRRRRELHARAGETIERLAGEDTDAVAEFLAMHYSAAHKHDKAWRYAVVAGDRAKDRYANVEAAAQYRVAVDAARHVDGISPGEVGRIYESLGDTCEMASLFDDADRAFQSARRLFSDDPAAVGRLMAKQGLLREKAGKLPTALAWFRRGLNLLGPTGDSESRASLLLAYGGIRFRQGKYREAVEWCERALEEPGATDDQRGHALYLLVTLYAHLGMFEATEAGRRAIAIYERTGDLVGMGNVLNNLGVDAYYRGNWDDALDLYERSGDARRRSGDVIGAAASVNNVAEIYSDQGKLEEAVEGFRHALYVWESSRFSVGVALASINLGRALTRSGGFVEAAEVLGRGLGLFEQMGAESYVHETRLRLAELDLFAGRRSAADRQAEQLLGKVGGDDATFMLRSALHRIRGYCADSAEDAERSLRMSLDYAERASSGFEVALTCEALTRLLPLHEEADVWNRRQIELLNQLGVIATPVVPLIAGLAPSV